MSKTKRLIIRYWKNYSLQMMLLFSVLNLTDLILVNYIKNKTYKLKSKVMLLVFRENQFVNYKLIYFKS